MNDDARAGRDRDRDHEHDRDHDDRADAGIEVRLTGWGIQDRHETLNSLIWGPDGWLYGCQGYATRSTVGKPVDGWIRPPREIGNFGDDYLYRALVALSGLAALEPAEATYLTCNTDQDHRGLDGKQRYVLRFPPGQMPPAKAFWSLTMYDVTPDGRAFFTDNPISRYAIGDRTEGLQYGADGSLEIHLQHERPAEALIANWLPAPAGKFILMLRMYWPDESPPSIIDGTWSPPAAIRRSRSLA